MSDILKMMVQRIGLGLLTLFVVSVIIFLGVSMLPGDAAKLQDPAWAIYAGFDWVAF